MFAARQTDYFNKKAKKFVNRNLKLAQLVDRTILEIINNPLSPNLKSHKVKTPRFGDCFSSSVNGDLRIIWIYDKEEIYVIDLLDIGGHSGKNKVY